MRRFLLFILLICSTLYLSSCVLFLKRSNFVLLQDADKYLDTSKSKVDPSGKAIDSIQSTLQVQPYDVLDIRVTKADEYWIKVPEAGGSASKVEKGGNTYNNGYLVDADGNIALPVVGKLMVRGKTLAQVKEMISDRVKSDLLRDPFVEVKFLTFRVTVLGAVTSPGIISVANERANLIDVLGYAGGITEFGKIYDIRVIRGEGSNKKVYKLDLRKMSVFSQKGYHILPNDIIYVEPTKRKFVMSNISTVALITGLVNTGFILISLFRIF